MITKKLDLNISIVKIDGVLEAQICIHILNIQKLYKRLKNNNKFPLKGLLGIDTYLDTYKIPDKKREEFIKTLQEFESVL